MALVNCYTTVQRFRDLTRIKNVNAVEDTVLEMWITDACRWIDRTTRHTFYDRTETHYFDLPWPYSRWLFIDDDDLLSVTTLTNGDGTVIAPSNYTLWPYNNKFAPYYTRIQLTWSSGLIWQWGTNGDRERIISVAGSWGFCTVANQPPEIEELAIDLVQSAYFRRFGDNNSSGQVKVTAAGIVITPQGLSDHSREILRAFSRQT